MNATELRKKIYKVLDQVIETGISVPIERKGRRLRIVLEDPVNKLDKLKKREGMNVDPDDIIELNWEQEWKPSM